ncbi:hypothetical protein MIT9_P1551 [Methylomarinovum caldicuralii]|uniref:Polyketide cyclase / dehydrase and lipid transport n=1 Tax=Methylomarinovum caldicuralii TaxID=438856 RepID=A0AAU9C474_9GAMM|nr:SRPBCC family protein [Methylomarinovum caldicuralii]BCX81969.1 hypothetical protein MIT9_P1551 [Methylomarinovum caldicuralii]
MIRYDLVTVWRLPASPARVWNVLAQAQSWPRWWPEVEKVEILTPENPVGVGARHRHHWRTRLGYRLCFELEVLRLEPLRRVDTRVSGDLVGRGRCLLRGAGNMTVVRVDWHVHTTKAWMNRISALAKPAFVWNHSRLMASGEAALAALLSSAANSSSASGTSCHSR